MRCQCQLRRTIFNIIKKVVRQALQPLRFAVCHRNIMPPCFLVHILLRHQFQISNHRGQRCAQVMGNARNQVVFCPLIFLFFRFDLLEFLLFNYIKYGSSELTLTLAPIDAIKMMVVFCPLIFLFFRFDLLEFLRHRVKTLCNLGKFIGLANNNTCIRGIIRNILTA